MQDKTFKALVVSESGEKQYRRDIMDRRIDDLPPGDVLVQVHYSSLNYKDALSASGNKGVTRKYPHTPGIDAAGVVEESSTATFRPGDAVIVTSYDLGMNTAGGFGQYIRVPAGWVVPLPEGLSLKESMEYGTAGFTAGLSVHALIHHGVQPDQGEILVSGATGGVGTMAVMILTKLGFRVAAVNGHTDASDYLRQIGAQTIINIEEATDSSGRPLLKSRWAGSIDAVGGELLATTIKSIHGHGVVTSCGNVASPDLPINVFPFILRGVTLVGIDSQNCPMPERMETWKKLAGEWKISLTAEAVEEVSLAGLDRCIDRMLNRGHRGRTVVNLTDAVN
ncbi:putative quinone oxidoreductase YhfP [Desulfosarcina cetonica]|uniref:YhdH/YhfP family quinone oxidoreductase n=1 Tax=Desulfosarcina cetonica TaxID=90730 RepID=UPI0006CF8C24|nr:YhdH/YhfP family quinone oxidoreductase [Desulfosarcina cetonica]VTR68452.1 putative quinone oxidoreductase YhfP [Desulfosarcina cetonica]